MDRTDCKRLFESIVQILLGIHDRLRKPERALETRARWDTLAAATWDNIHQASLARCVCDSLEMCLDRVHAIRRDIANGKLHAISPVIQTHGIEYERSHFKRKLETGKVTLAATRAWIRSAVGRSPETAKAALRAGSASAFEDLLQRATVDLVVAGSESLPETWMLDRLRIESLRQEFHQQVDSATTLLSLAALCCDAKKAAVMEEASQAAADGGSVLLVLDRHLAPAEKAAVLDAVGRNLERGSQLRSVAVRHVFLHCSLVPRNKKTKCCCVLQATRFRDVWAAVLGQAEEEDNDKQIPSPARCIVPAARKSALQLRKLFRLNREVHLQLYNRLIRDSAA